MKVKSFTDDKGRLMFALTFIALAVFALFLIATAVNVSDDSDATVDEIFTVGGIKYKVLTESEPTGTVSVEPMLDTSNKGTYSGIVDIPEYVEYKWSGSSTTYTYTVVKLDINAFKDCPHLDAVIVPGTVTSFGKDSMKSYTLTDVIIRNTASVCSLDDPSNFAYLTTTFHVRTDLLDDYKASWTNYERQLTSYKEYTDDNDNAYFVFNSVLYIDNGTEGTGILGDFTDANVKTKLGITEDFISADFDSGITTIGAHMFFEYAGLESVTMDNSVTSIGDNAFSGCNNLNKITLSTLLTTIGNGAFSGCSSLESITITSSVTSIGNSAFSNCSLLIGEASDIRIHILCSSASLGTNAFPTGSYMDLPNGTKAAYSIAANWEDYKDNFNEASSGTYKVSYALPNTGTGYRNLTYGQINQTFSTITTNIPAGHRFAGIFEKENGQGIQYVSSDYKLIRPWDRTQDTTLYVYWVPVKAAILLRNASYVNEGYAIATYGSPSLYRFTPVLDRPGYTLDGYYYGNYVILVNTSGELQKNTDYTDSSGNWKVYSSDRYALNSKWTVNHYTITLPEESARIGYTITATKTVVTVSDYTTITLVLVNGYRMSAPTVSSNGVPLTPTTHSGSTFNYNLSKISEDLLITVEDIDVDTPKIYVSNATLVGEVYTATYSSNGIILTAASSLASSNTYPAGTEYTWTLGSEETEDDTNVVNVKNAVVEAHYRVSITLNGVTKTCADDVVLTINKKDLSVTAKNTTIYYGDDAANNGVTYSGFVSGEDESVLGGTLSFVYSYDKSNPTARAVDDYTITPSGLTSDNYNISYNDGTLTVAKATLTVTADDKMITYGGNAPIYTVSYNGFKYGETQSVISGLTITCPYDNTDPTKRAVATYDITPSGATASNYSVSPVNGNLTVKQADLDVNATKNVTYSGESTYVWESYSAGFYGDLINLIYTPVSKNADTYIFGDADKGFALTYLEEQNYKIVSAGNLVISKKDVTVTGWEAPADLVYSGTPKVPTALLSGICGTDECKVTMEIETGTDNINVGTFSMTTTGVDNSNYNLPVGSTSDVYSIVKAIPSSIHFTITLPADLIYNGSKKTVTVVLKDGLTGIGTFTATNIENTDAGTYTISISATGGSNFDEANDVVIGSYTITKANPSAQCFTVTMPSNLVYDGNPKVATVVLKDGLTGMGNITIAYSDNVNVGTCNVTVSVTEGSNFTAADNVSVGSFEITAQPVPASDNSGLITGIVVGVIAVLAVIGVAVVIYLRKNFYF